MKLRDILNIDDLTTDHMPTDIIYTKTIDDSKRTLDDETLVVGFGGEAPEGFIEFMDVELALDWLESFEDRDDPAQECIDYSIQIAKDVEEEHQRILAKKRQKESGE